VSVPRGIPVNQQFDPPADWSAMFGVLMDRAWILGLFVILALSAAAYYAKSAPRIYEATATVQVEQEEQHPLKIEQLGKEDLRALEIMNTIVQKLSSRPLLERVLVTNGLANPPHLTGSPEKPPPTREQLLAGLAGMVKVTLRRNTRLIDVRVTNPDSLMAAQIANSVVEQYMSQDFEFRSASAHGAFAYLQAESARLKKKLEASEQTLQSYREEVGSVSMLKSDDLLLPQLRELNLRMPQAKGESIQLKTAYQQVEHCQTNVSELLMAPQIRGDSSVIEAQSLVGKLESDFSLVQQRYKAKHPKYIQAASQLEEARRALANSVMQAAESLRVAYENAQSAEKGMNQAVHDAEDASLKLSQKAIRYNLLAREVESDQALFDNVLSRLKETSLATDIQSEKIRLIAPATPSAVPASPKITVIFGAALMAGLMLGGALAFFWGSLDTSFKTVDDLEQYIRLPVLTAVLRLREIRKAGRPLLNTEGLYSPAAEAFRTLRTSLAMLGREEHRRSFLFTSALPQEGKTFSSMNFAASLAQQGLRTLLIDADLRRPAIAGYLAAEHGQPLPGVTDYLLGRKSLPDLVRPLEGLEHFFWMAAGSPPANPADLLAQGKFKDLIAEALKKYDRVVVDSAPINVVSDTLLIADHVHITVLVVHGRNTPRKAVLRCVQVLQKAGASLEGVVLNLLPRRRSCGYTYYHACYDPGHSNGHKGGPESGAVACPVEALDKAI
jgi:capsular exopolysaccharide synthesis family protein